jgi:hypothetical protein
MTRGQTFTARPRQLPPTEPARTPTARQLELQREAAALIDEMHPPGSPERDAYERMGDGHDPFPTVEQIASKRQRGHTLTAWESSVYRLNFRDDGTRYSADPKTREAQYAADNARTMKARGRGGDDGR